MTGTITSNLLNPESENEKEEQLFETGANELMINGEEADLSGLISLNLSLLFHWGVA
jgi:hypothetical protein